ncbi:hypothetical protein [Pararhizobium mangrovi]|uniref:Uncharacterized protein n=1 Tax=Pararhizobium mangrovi TaxID=2590452 RepID=A0A506UA18_9HYPH|nr:hypothetical protein [Pararhizobium mangrovi]TPW31282.1 hypothetical protein FJU11_03535 [Pararhizobium mangrovi]
MPRLDEPLLALASRLGAMDALLADVHAVHLHDAGGGNPEATGASIGDVPSGWVIARIDSLLEGFVVLLVQLADEIDAVREEWDAFRTEEEESGRGRFFPRGWWSGGSVTRRNALGMRFSHLLGVCDGVDVLHAGATRLLEIACLRAERASKATTRRTLAILEEIRETQEELRALDATLDHAEASFPVAADADSAAKLGLDHAEHRQHREALTVGQAGRRNHLEDWRKQGSRIRHDLDGLLAARGTLRLVGEKAKVETERLVMFASALADDRTADGSDTVPVEMDERREGTVRDLMRARSDGLLSMPECMERKAWVDAALDTHFSGIVSARPEND